MEIRQANLHMGYLRPRTRTDFIILHHAAGTGSVEAVNAYHKRRGWKGIGYNFYVRRDGSVWEGRGLDKVGAHTAGFNENSIGICAEGNFEKEKMSEAQKKALTELLAFVWGKFPNAKVIRHRAVAATACPGRNYPIDAIIEGARKITDVPKEAEKPIAESKPTGGAFVSLPILRRGSRGDSVKALQALLIGYGYNLGGWGADGSFGGATQGALVKFQTANKLTADGICGANTWRKLMGA